MNERDVRRVSRPRSKGLFHAPFLFLNQHLRINRLGANRTDIAPCGLVEVGLANLPAVRAPDDKRFFFLAFWHEAVLWLWTLRINHITS